MTPSFIKSSPSPFYGGSNENNDQHHHHQYFGPNYNQAASASSYSYHFYFNPTQDQTGNYHSEVYKHQQQLEGNNYVAYGIGNKRKDHENEGEKNPGKWMMPSKMKISITQQKSLEKTRSTKMNREDQKQRSSSMETDHSSHSSTNTLIRVCSDCNTTKTPLWRSGPKGPKSLCNACGIRQRKARRALADAATASAANGTVERESTPTVKIKVQPKEKTKMNGLSTVPFKKRCKVIASGLSEDPTKKKQLGFEDYLISLSKNLAFHHVFPQDEKEGAILLMALSCGLVHTSS